MHISEDNDIYYENYTTHKIEISHQTSSYSFENGIFAKLRLIWIWYKSNTQYENSVGICNEAHIDYYIITQSPRTSM